MAGGGPKTESGLTAKQEAFCNEYLFDLDPAKAALRAGYAANRAKRFGRDLMKDARIVSRIQLLMDRRGRAVDVTPERVLEEIGRILFSDIRDVMTWEDGKVRWKDSTEIPDNTAPAIQEVYETEREMDDGGVFRTKRIRFYDKLKAGDLAMKHLGMAGSGKGLEQRVADEVARQKAGEMEELFKKLEEQTEGWREEQEKALPEEKMEKLDAELS